jgi:hypothetical protein
MVIVLFLCQNPFDGCITKGGIDLKLCAITPRHQSELFAKSKRSFLQAKLSDSNSN